MSEVYLGLCHNEMEPFADIISSERWLIIVAKIFIIDIWQIFGTFL